MIITYRWEVHSILLYAINDTRAAFKWSQLRCMPQHQKQVARSPMLYISLFNIFIKHTGFVLKETVHLQKNVKQIIFKQILYLKCEE